MRPWPAVRQRPPIIQREFRGENKLDAYSLRDTFSTSAVNLTNTKFPAVSTRPGYTVVGSFGGKVLGMGVWQEKELHVVTSDGKWRRLNGDGTWTELASGLDASAEWSFTNFKGELNEVSLIGTNGITPKVYNGTTVADLTGVPAGAKYITQFADRLWAAVGITLHYSAYRMAKDWTAVNLDDADSGNAVMESDDGEVINSIQGGLTKLTVTKPSAVFALFGYAPSDYSVRKVTTDTGQLSPRAAATMEGWLYQLYDNGLYQYPGSGTPSSAFSDRVKDYFDRMNRTGRTAAAMGSDGNKLYLSLPINSTTPDTVIEYDPRKDTYYRWTGMTALQFVQMRDQFYIGDATGNVLKMGGSTDNGTAIEWEWVSKPFTGQSMSQVIRWFRTWITMDLPAGSTFKVHLSKNGTDWVQAGATVTGSGPMVRKRYDFPSNMVANANEIWVKFSGTGPMTIYEFAREEEQMPMR